MTIFANFIQAITFVLDMVLDLYFWIVIISALLSWVNPDPYNPIVKFLRSVTEPVFYRVRRLLPFVYMGGMDLSPIVVILAIQFARIFIIGSLRQLAFVGF